MTHINRERHTERERETTKREDKRAPFPTQAHTHKHTTNTQRQASPWNMTDPRWRRWGWGKPYCNNLILWSLIASCCSSLPDRVCWAYVKHISPLSVGALPASSNAAQRHKPWELPKADRPDNLPLRTPAPSPEPATKGQRDAGPQGKSSSRAAAAAAAATPLHSKQIAYIGN